VLTLTLLFVGCSSLLELPATIGFGGEAHDGGASALVDATAVTDARQSPSREPLPHCGASVASFDFEADGGASALPGTVVSASSTLGVLPAGGVVGHVLSTRVTETRGHAYFTFPTETLVSDQAYCVRLDFRLRVDGPVSQTFLGPLVVLLDESLPAVGIAILGGAPARITIADSSAAGMLGPGELLPLQEWLHIAMLLSIGGKGSTVAISIDRADGTSTVTDPAPLMAKLSPSGSAPLSVEFGITLGEATPDVLFDDVVLEFAKR
jgi:hypothetical protein